MSDEKILMAKEAIADLSAGLKSTINELNDPLKQLSDMSVIVNNFVLQTLGAVNENNDLAAVNELLTNSLVQIRNFTNARQGEVSRALTVANEKLSAYEQCLIIIEEIQKLELNQNPEESGEEKELDDETFSRISEDIDSDGNYTKVREYGERPEKLKDIRAAEDKVRSSNNFSEG